MNEFLNPKSMTTPGVAGAMVMFVANSICFQFPEIEFRWAVIALSFLAGAIVFSAKDLRFSHRVVFLVLNSLIIFSVGVGTSNIAAKVQNSTPENQLISNNTFFDLLIPSANAQEPSIQNRPEAVPKTIEYQLAIIIQRLESQAKLILELKNENEKLKFDLAKLQAINSHNKESMELLPLQKEALKLEKIQVEPQRTAKKEAIVKRTIKQKENAIKNIVEEPFFRAW